MLKHKDIWRAIDLLAESHGLSASGLAKKAGLDSTSFNPSKRIAKDGKPRWPSTESLAKVLECTGEDFDKINSLINPDAPLPPVPPQQSLPSFLPIISAQQASQDGFFDANGAPLEKNWDTMTFPAPMHPQSYAMEVSDSSMEPLYRQGDILIVEPDARKLRRGDRVVIKTIDGSIMARQLNRIGEKQISLTAFNNGDADTILDKDDVLWVSRILWVSQ